MLKESDVLISDEDLIVVVSVLPKVRLNLAKQALDSRYVFCEQRFHHKQILIRAPQEE